MSELQAIAAVYERIDLHLESTSCGEASAGEEPAPGPVDREQSINDQAFFVLAWGQLEADIEEACRDAIRAGQSLRTGGIAEHGACTIQTTVDSPA